MRSDTVSKDPAQSLRDNPLLNDTNSQTTNTITPTPAFADNPELFPGAAIRSDFQSLKINVQSKTIDSVSCTRSVLFQNLNKIGTSAPSSPKLNIGAYTTTRFAAPSTTTSNSNTTATGLLAADKHLSGNPTRPTDPGNTPKQAYFAHILPQA